MAVVKYMEGIARMHGLDKEQFKDHVSRSSESSCETISCILCFQDSLEMFEKMHHYLGCVLSAEKLYDV